MQFKKLNKLTYKNIDVIKLCMAVLVVATHTSFFSFIKSPEVYNIVFTALSVKVPFFFAASGFLVWNKLCDASFNDRIDRLGGWMKKTLRLYLIWTLIYMPFTIYGFYLDGLGIGESILIFLRNFLLIGHNFYSFQLWYLLGTLVASIIVYGLVRSKWKLKTLYYIAFVLAIIGVLLDFCDQNNYLPEITSVYYRLFGSTRNGFFQGLPYVVIGISVANDGVINSKTALWTLLIISFIAHILGCNLATFLMTYALLSLVTQYDFKKEKDELYKSFRLTSTIIYLVHMLWVGFFTFIVHISNDIVLFAIVLLASFVSSFIAIKNKDTIIVRLLFR